MKHLVQNIPNCGAVHQKDKSRLAPFMSHNPKSKEFEEIKRYILRSASKHRSGVDGSWDTLLAKLIEPFERGSNDQAAFEIGLELGYFSQYTTFRNPRYQQAILEWHEGYLLNLGFDLVGHLMRIEESPLLSGLCVSKGSKLVGIELYRFFTYLQLLNAHGFGSEDIIVEVGGGYGGLARVIKTLSPRSTYVVVDMLESLCYSAYFLTQSFPGASVLMVTEDNIDGLTPDKLKAFDFVFLPEFLIESLKGIKEGLFINIFSFGEMNNTKVKRFFKMAQELNHFTKIALLNIVFQKASPANPASFDQGEWMTYLDKEWEILSFEANPKLIQCPYITSLPSSLAILASKSITKSESARAIVPSISTRLERVCCCDWVHFSLVDKTMPSPSEAFYKMLKEETCVLPIPATFDFNSYSMLYASGTLRLRVYGDGHDQTFFDLFEINRLAPTQLSIYLIKLYLRIIARATTADDGYILKEEYYYGRMLSGSFENTPAISIIPTG